MTQKKNLEDILLYSDYSSAKAELLELKEIELCERLKIKAEILRGDIIKRPAAAAVIGDIYGIYRNTVLVMDYSMGDILSFKLGIKEVHKLYGVIEEELYKLIGKINEGVTKHVESL